MMYETDTNGIPLDLRLTLMESGQCFAWRYDVDSGRYGAVVSGCPVWLRSEGARLTVEGEADEAALRRYLALDEDYGSLLREDETLAAAMELLPGLRLLRQEPWDVLVMFLLSQNNNLRRIKRLCDGVSERYGRFFDTPFGPLYAFPAPEALASMEPRALRELGAGYRAEYLVGTARCVCEGFPLERLRSLPYAEAHALLLRLPGVGDKVADCVQLFGCGCDEAFPVDVWVERLLRGWYGMEAASRSELAEKARMRFGSGAGIAQQFLFHAARTGLIKDRPLEG